MLGFLRRGDVFAQRQKQQEVWRSVRRIIDRTSPNLCLTEDGRSYERCQRCVPMLVVSCESDTIPAVPEAIFGLSKDFSDDGISCITSCELTKARVICGFHLDVPLFFWGEVCRSVPFGGGYWQAGISLLEVLPTVEVESLVPLCESLLATTAEPTEV